MTSRRSCLLASLMACLGLVSACRTSQPAGPDSDEAHRFIETAEKRLDALFKKSARAAWVQNNFITVDTQQIAADAQSDLAAAVSELARGARRFEGLQLPEDDARKLKLLKLQRAGKSAQAADAFLRGFALAAGTVLAPPAVVPLPT